MKRRQPRPLGENSKTTKRVPGEIGSVDYDSDHTPDNHVAKKKTRTVDGKKGLGQRPDGKKVAQVQPPKARERRSMQEHLGRPDSKPHMDGKSSAQTNRDEGMKKPAVAKPKAPVARDGRIEKRREKWKTNAANIGKTRHLDRSYTSPVPVEVKKVQESLQRLVAMLGPLRLDEGFVGEFMEDFPEDIERDEDEGGDEFDGFAMEIEDAVTDYLDGDEARSHLDDYESTKDRDDRVGIIYNLFDGAYGEVKKALPDEDEIGERDAKDAFVKALDGRVDQDELDEALKDYLGESMVEEDHLYPEGGDNSLRSAERILSRLGYQMNGGGWTGGRKNYRGPEGTVSFRVHSFNPDQVIGWTLQANTGDDYSGTTVAELRDAIQKARSAMTNPEPETDENPLRALRKARMGQARTRTREMSSGGGMSAGGMATGFMDEDRDATHRVTMEMTQAQARRMPFMEYVAAVDTILEQEFGTTDAKVGIIREDMREYADAQRRGLTPLEMAKHWVRNGRRGR